MELNLNQEKLFSAVVKQIADEFMSNDDSLYDSIRAELMKRIDKVFAEKIEKLLNETAEKMFKEGLEHEYVKTSQWGDKQESTTIKKEMERVIGAYWNENVDSQTGNLTSSSYRAIKRAEYLMLRICSDDFNAQMKEAAITVTAQLKDGFRDRLAREVDVMLDSLFRVQSHQDQGKKPKAWKK